MPSFRHSTPFLNGETIIPMDDQAWLTWREVALSFQKADGTPYTDAVTGAATIEIQGAYADVWEDGQNPLDLATDRRWAPFLTGLSQVKVTVTGAPSDAYCVVTVISQ